MIDTIALRIHDLKKHESLALGLMKESAHSKTYRSKIYDSDSFLEFRNMNQVIDQLKYGDTGQTLVKRHLSKLVAPSSIYYLGYYVDPLRDFIHLEFSIPKYLYGNNVAQFVPCWYSRRYHSVDSMSFTFSGRISFEMLQEFIIYFIKREFLDEPIDFTQLEVNRLDLCYNQYFLNQADALDYLEIQKKRKPKGLSEFSDASTIRKTSIVYNTSLYYAKIYHKGSEFQNDDRPELIKWNNAINDKIKLYRESRTHKIGFWDLQETKNEVARLQRKMFDIDFISQQANRILRYEITFRPSAMSYFYKRYIWRKNDPAWRDLFNQYNKLHTIVVNKGILNLSREEKSIYNKVRKMLSKRHKFYVRLSREAQRKSQMSFTDEVLPDALYSNELHKMLFDKFHKFIQMFQVTELPPDSQALIQVAEFNQRIKMRKKTMPKKIIDNLSQTVLRKNDYSRINPGKVQKVLELLKVYTFDEMVKRNLYSRATIHRIKQDLNRLGIDPNSNIPHGHGIRVRTDYSDYHITNNADFRLFGNQQESMKQF